MISRTDTVFNKSVDLFENVPDMPDKVKELIEFLDGFGMKYASDSECDIIMAFNSHVKVDIWYYMSDDIVISMNCQGEWGCPFILDPPSSKRDYKSLMSYIFLLEWMHKRNISYSALSCPVEEYGRTFDDKQIYKDSRAKELKRAPGNKVVANKIKNKPLYRENWI